MDEGRRTTDILEEWRAAERLLTVMKNPLKRPVVRRRIERLRLEYASRFEALETEAIDPQAPRHIDPEDERRAS
jgi:hypothetical protein